MNASRTGLRWRRGRRLQAARWSCSSWNSWSGKTIVESFREAKTSSPKLLVSTSNNLLGRTKKNSRKPGEFECNFVLSCFYSVECVFSPPEIRFWMQFSQQWWFVKLHVNNWTTHLPANAFFSLAFRWACVCVYVGVCVCCHSEKKQWHVAFGHVSVFDLKNNVKKASSNCFSSGWLLLATTRTSNFRTKILRLPR